MNLLGEINGGPIEAATQLFYDTDRMIEETGRSSNDVIDEIGHRYREEKQYLPGFGHPVHDRETRVIRLFELVAEMAMCFCCQEICPEKAITLK